jgi:ribonucrease Y
MEIRALLQPWRRLAPDADDSHQADGDEGSPTDELRARREEIARMEERALREVESLEVQRADLERRQQTLEDRERNLDQQGEELKRAKRVQRRELERISGLNSGQARQLLIAEVEQEARHQAALRLQEIEQETKR